MKQQQQETKQATERGARVLKRAIEIMAKGARGWSEALSRAEKETT